MTLCGCACLCELSLLAYAISTAGSIFGLNLKHVGSSNGCHSGSSFCSNVFLGLRIT